MSTKQAHLHNSQVTKNSPLPMRVSFHWLNSLDTEHLCRLHHCFFWKVWAKKNFY